MGLSVPLKRNILPEDPIAPKSDRMEFLTYMQIEALAINGKKNKFKGASVTVAILAGDECARQMRNLQLSKNPTDQKNFARYMSDEFDSLPVRITVPTFVFWMNRELGKRGKDLPSDHPEIRSKCASFYDSGSKGYQGFFSKMQAAKILTNKEQIGASGALQKDGRSAVLLWLSKDYMLGDRFRMKPKKASQIAENEANLETKTGNLVANEPLFLDPKTGNSCQSIDKEISKEISNHKSTDTKQCGEKKSAETGEVGKMVSADFFSVKNMAAPERINAGTGKTAHLNASAKRPEHAIPPPPRENFEDAEGIRIAKLIAENAQEIAEKLTEIYKIALEKGQVRGSGNKIITPETFPQWAWKHITPSVCEVLRVLRRDGEMLFETRTRIMKVLEIEQNRLKNPQKYLLLPFNYLNTQRTADNSDWVMSSGSLVAFHDRLHKEKQLETRVESDFAPDNRAEFEEKYRKAFGHKVKILKQLNINQYIISRREEDKGFKNIVETVDYVLHMHQKGEIKKSLRHYMLKALRNCGWTMQTTKEAVQACKNIEKFEQYKKFYNAFLELPLWQQNEIYYNLSIHCSHNDVKTKGDVYVLFCKNVSEIVTKNRNNAATNKN